MQVGQRANEILDDPRNPKAPLKKFTSIIYFLMAGAILGQLFRLMHWPGFSYIMITTVGGLAFFYTFRFLDKPEKSFYDVLKWLIVLTGGIWIVLSQMHWPGTSIALATFAITLATYIVGNGRLELPSHYYKPDPKITWATAIFRLGGVICIMGILSNLLAFYLLWDEFNALYLIIAGVVIAIVGFVLMVREKQEDPSE